MFVRVRHNKNPQDERNWANRLHGGEECSIYLPRKYEAKSTFGRPRRKWGHNVRTHIRELGPGFDLSSGKEPLEI